MGRQVLAMLDEYASGPMGGNTPLPAHVHRDLIRNWPAAPRRALLARVDGEPAGVAIYLEGFSTFACRPLLNLHDLGVSPRFQGQGVGKRCCPRWSCNAAALMGCCKITLEVLEGNAVAQGLYRKQGYEGYALDEHTGRALFWQKKLAA